MQLIGVTLRHHGFVHLYFFDFYIVNCKHQPLLELIDLGADSLYVNDYFSIQLIVEVFEVEEI